MEYLVQQVHIIAYCLGGVCVCERESIRSQCQMSSSVSLFLGFETGYFTEPKFQGLAHPSIRVPPGSLCLVFMWVLGI